MNFYCGNVVEVINAHAPVERDYLIGDIEVGMFDERGGVFHSYKHGVTVIIPVGAIPSGILAELKFAATLISPVPFQSNTVPFSAIFWLCMNSLEKLDSRGQYNYAYPFCSRKTLLSPCSLQKVHIRQRLSKWNV